MTITEWMTKYNITEVRITPSYIEFRLPGFENTFEIQEFKDDSSIKLDYYEVQF